MSVVEIADAFDAESTAISENSALVKPDVPQNAPSSRCHVWKDLALSNGGP